MYSVDTGAFFSEEEARLQRRVTKNKRFKAALEKRREDPERIAGSARRAGERIKKATALLKQTLDKGSGVRALRPEQLTPRHVVSLFESTLTRTLQLEIDALTTDLLIVQTYYYAVLRDLVFHGFDYLGEHYVCFTASAGQIRTKKTMFIKEALLKRHRAALMCGLTVEDINAQGGVNVNKYLAYLALCNSATDRWADFDIDRAIVVDDFETAVEATVDAIDEGTYKVTRERRRISINHTDGCGMILPGCAATSRMVRMPWIKGLLVPFAFDRFLQNHPQADSKVKDIYGRTYDLIADRIEIVFTRSQFKMWPFYPSWDAYKQAFKRYGCQAAIGNEEEEAGRDAHFNYQMLQTLDGLGEEELRQMCAATNTRIRQIGSSRETMLRVLGADRHRARKNYYQQALTIYPELLADTYSREVLKQVKRGLVKRAWGGKIRIDGKHTFICPDLYAFCERLLLGIEAPRGLLADGEVSCSLYPDKPKLDCLRSPHLYREHAVRRNVVDQEKKRWFITRGLYTSCHDSISLLLMFDADGDKSLVCAEETLIRAAERQMQDIVPLHYPMGKAQPSRLEPKTIYEGLIAAYSGGNIGKISNDITKIWNSAAPDLDVIKWLCMENNFTIDYAKTLYKPVRPPRIDERVKACTRARPPHFFVYAKDKREQEVEPAGDRIVDRLRRTIVNARLNFSAANLGTFDYRLLKYKPSAPARVDPRVVDRYAELDRHKRFMTMEPLEQDSSGDHLYVYKEIRRQLLEVQPDLDIVTDMLVDHLYKHQNSSFKTTLWSSFGDVLVRNLQRNVKQKLTEGYMACIVCGKRTPHTSNNKRHCTACAAEARRRYKAEKARQYRAEQAKKRMGDA
ncbi:RNA dependent RNA polymerase [Paenibacillus sabuli]|nr:hypothetical protein [Paenibacillus sabuli]